MTEKSSSDNRELSSVSDLVDAQPSLVLASASPARQKILTDAGLNFVVQPSTVDEDHFSNEHNLTAASEMALGLAEAKADDVAYKLLDTSKPHDEPIYVIGCDSVFEMDGIAYGKPHSPEVAKERISTLQSRSGQLHTGMSLKQVNPCKQTIDGVKNISTTTVHFAPMSSYEIDQYVHSSEPLEVAGSFTLDGKGAAFISHIEGNAANVIGLNVKVLKDLLAEYGLEITNFWE